MGKFSIEDYAADAKYATVVSELRAIAQGIISEFRDRTIWMVNSTAQGGGVAEMLPAMIALMSDLGFTVRWAVITTSHKGFFKATKRLHNLIHGDAREGVDFDSDEIKLYEKVNLDNARALRPQIHPEDILVVHDPQPVPLGQFLARETGALAVWRCHIGLDRKTDATTAAWRFLRPYLDGYSHTVFSAPEYIPSYLGGRASVISPALDPLSYKNRDLSVSKLVGILCNSGLAQQQEPVPTPDYEQPVLKIDPDGNSVPPVGLGLPFRPVVLQVSRWDRLKGWGPLLDGFVELKKRLKKRSNSDLNERNLKRLQLCRLVLAGPDPESISDDPEGLEVFTDICERYRHLSAEHQNDVSVLLLPMASRKHNALIVNALQRCAAIVVQNSIEEGFGLTVAEAMWKQIPVLGTRACGIRQQIRDGLDGRLVQNPEDPSEIAGMLREMIVNPRGRFLMGRNGQRRVYDQFLIFRQISKYLELFRHLSKVQDTQPRIDLGELRTGGGRT